MKLRPTLPLQEIVFLPEEAGVTFCGKIIVTDADGDRWVTDCLPCFIWEFDPYEPNR